MHEYNLGSYIIAISSLDIKLTKKIIFGHNIHQTIYAHQG